MAFLMCVMIVIEWRGVERVLYIFFSFFLFWYGTYWVVVWGGHWVAMVGVWTWSLGVGFSHTDMDPSSVG